MIQAWYDTTSLWTKNAYGKCLLVLDLLCFTWNDSLFGTNKFFADFTKEWKWQGLNCSPPEWQTSVGTTQPCHSPFPFSFLHFLYLYLFLQNLMPSWMVFAFSLNLEWIESQHYCCFIYRPNSFQTITLWGIFLIMLSQKLFCCLLFCILCLLYFLFLINVCCAHWSKWDEN